MHSEKQVRIRVAGILLKDNEVLLIAHKKDSNVYWLLPGGGVDFGESLEEALCREFREELHIDINVGKVALVFDSIDPHGSRHIVNICFYCNYRGGEVKLGKEKRLYDYSFIEKEKIESLAMFPPINRDLIAIMNKENVDNTYQREIYKGKLWMEKC